MPKNANGKGDSYRKVDTVKYDNNFPFPSRTVKLWPRDAEGNLIDEDESEVLDG